MAQFKNDTAADMAWIQLAPVGTPIERTIDFGNVLIDFDSIGNVVGIELFEQLTEGN